MTQQKMKILKNFLKINPNTNSNNLSAFKIQRKLNKLKKSKKLRVPILNYSLMTKKISQILKELSSNSQILTKMKKSRKVLFHPNQKINRINKSSNNSKFGKSHNKLAKRKNKEIMTKIFVDTSPDQQLGVSWTEPTKKKSWNFANNFLKNKNKTPLKMCKICTTLRPNFCSAKQNLSPVIEHSEAFCVLTKILIKNPKNVCSEDSPTGS